MMYDINEFKVFCLSMGLKYEKDTGVYRHVVGECWGCIISSTYYMANGKVFTKFDKFKKYVIKLINTEKKKFIKNKLKEINSDFKKK